MIDEERIVTSATLIPAGPCGRRVAPSAIEGSPINADVRRRKIIESAYFHAERRGFEPGHETEDWLRAENEVDSEIIFGVLPPDV
ncbi:MAG: DUF2934 domain-containing protein [Steroidobacteraceae bacterium]